MKNCFFIPLSLFICLFIISCNESTNPDNIIKPKGLYTSIKNDQTIDVLLPLRIGNFWVYRFLFDTTGKNYIMWGTDTLIVTGETLLNSDKFFIVASTIMSYNSYFVSNTDIGVWYYDDYGEQSNYLEVKYPVKDNDIYKSVIMKYISIDSIHYTVQAERQLKVETNQNVEVYAGTFNCYKFSESFDNFQLAEPISDTIKTYKHIFYYALNVGKIKEEIYKVSYFDGKETYRELFMTYFLKEYKLY